MEPGIGTRGGCRLRGGGRWDFLRTGGRMGGMAGWGRRAGERVGRRMDSWRGLSSRTKDGKERTARAAASKAHARADHGGFKQRPGRSAAAATPAVGASGQAGTRQGQQGSKASSNASVHPPGPITIDRGGAPRIGVCSAQQNPSAARKPGAGQADADAVVDTVWPWLWPKSCSLAQLALAAPPADATTTGHHSAVSKTGFVHARTRPRATPSEP